MINIPREVQISENISEVKPVQDFKGEILSSIGESLKNTAKTMESKILANAEFDFNNNAVNNISAMYEENQSNPAALKTNLDAFWKGYSKKIPPESQNKIYGLYNDLSNKYIQKASSNYNSVLDNEYQFNILQTEHNLKTQTEILASDLFSSDINKSKTSAVNLLDAMANHDKLYNSTRTDGTPLFTPQQRMQASLEFKKDAIRNSLKAKVQESDNPMSVISYFENNEVVIPKIEGISEAPTIIPLTLEDKLDITKDLYSEMNSKINYKEKLINIEEKEKDRIGRTGMQAVMGMKSEGKEIPKDIVKLLSPYLDAKGIKELHSIVNNPDPISSNGDVLKNLRQSAVQGVNISDAARSSYDSGELTFDDYKNLEEYNNQYQGKVTNPVAVGRNYIDDTSKTITDFSPSFSSKTSQGVNEAKAQYELEIETRRKNGVQVSPYEAIEIAKQSLYKNLNPQTLNTLGIKLNNSSNGVVADTSNVKDSMDKQKIDLINKYKNRGMTNEQMASDKNFISELNKINNAFKGIQ